MSKAKIAVACAAVALVVSSVWAGAVNVALQDNGGTASAISEGYYYGLHPASWANDGNPATDWCSEWSMPAWLKVQFNQPYEIDKVAVAVDYHQQTYSVSLSPDGANWQQVVAPHLSSNIPSSCPTYESAGHAYESFNIDPMVARFMKVDVTTTSAPGSHIFQSVVTDVGAYQAPAVSSSGFSEHFATDTVGTWPSPDWVANANAVSDPSRNQVVVDPANADNKVLRLFGTTSGSWGANAFSACDFGESYTMNVSVRNGSETLSGVQPYRASIGMRHGTDWPAWTNPARTLLLFGSDGNVVTGDGRVLQPYDTDRWYDVSIQYNRVGTNLTLHYWIDGIDRGSSLLTIDDLAVERSLDHVGLTAHQGSAYFDNLSVVPEPATLSLLALGGLAMLRRRK